ncbi:hypothetical protein D3C72_454890 [compost metagenome]
MILASGPVVANKQEAVGLPTASTTRLWRLYFPKTAVMPTRTSPAEPPPGFWTP